MFENKLRYRGVIPPLITPLKGDRTLDEEGLHRLIDFLIDRGVSGVFSMGTSGEAMMTSRKVWLDAVRASVRFAAGRADVFLGVIDASTERVIESIRLAEDAGGGIFVVTPAFYLQNRSQDEILRHYEAVAAATEGKIVAYNIPDTTHVNILPETARRIAEIDNVVALKDSAGSWEQFQREIYLLEDRDIALFNGAEELSAAAVAFGAQGLVPGLANSCRSCSWTFTRPPPRRLPEAARLQRDVCACARRCPPGSTG
jgi:4-hydroxy-tetrahydrodipicolinate synthase